MAENAERIAEDLAELALSFRDYLETIEFNPRRLEQVEDRLDLIHNLTRKYGGSVESVLKYEQESSQRLENLENAGEKIAGIGER